MRHMPTTGTGWATAIAILAVLVWIVHFIWRRFERDDKDPGDSR